MEYLVILYCITYGYVKWLIQIILMSDERKKRPRSYLASRISYLA